MVLQVSAWTSMVIARAPEMGLAAAVGTTFDGRHPCRMCKAVAEGQQEDAEKTGVMVNGIVKELKLVAFVRCEVPPCADLGEVRWPEPLPVLVRGSEPPPTPPPVA